MNQKSSNLKLFFFLAILASFQPSISSALVTPPAGSGPSTFSYEGRVYDSVGNPSSAQLSFVVRVFDPSGSCMLREEQTSVVNLATTNGYFSVTVGANTLTGSDPGLSLQQVFANSGTLTGASSCTYAPSGGDGRKLRILVYDGASYTSMTPDIAIGTAPFALAADTLQGHPASAFLMSNTSSAALTQSGLESIFSSATNIATLSSLLDGTSSLYARTSSATSFSGSVSFATPPTVSGAPVTGTDVVNKNYSDSQIGGRPASSFTTVGIGQFIQWNGSQWVAANGVTNAGGVPQVQAGTDTAKVAGTAGRIYFATDTFKIYRDNGSTFDQLGSSGAPTGTASGDLGGSYPSPSVTKIQGKPVSSTTPLAGSVLKSDGTTWNPDTVKLSDLRSSVTGPLFSNILCNAGETLQYSSVSDNFNCTALVSFNNDVAFNSTGSIKLPSGTPAMRPGTPADGMVRFNNASFTYEGYANGAWNNFLLTTPSGNLGLGTSSPSSRLHTIDNPTAVAGIQSAARFDTNSSPSGATSATYAASNSSASNSSPNMAGGVVVGALNQASSSTQASSIVGTMSQAHYSGSVSQNRLSGIEATAFNDSTSGSIANAMGVYSKVAISAAGSIANAYGVFIDNLPTSNVTNKWALFTSDATPSAFGGPINVGAQVTPAEMLDVNGNARIGGQVYSSVVTVSTGTVADANQGNTFVFVAPSVGTLTINNMKNGAHYTVVIQDTTSRMYTFSSCSTSRFKPTNVATTTSTQSIYKIVFVSGTCYIDWSSGY